MSTSSLTEVTIQGHRIKRERDDIATYEAMLGTVEKMLSRSDNIHDPVTKNVVFVDKLYLIIDLSVSFAEVAMKRLQMDADDKDGLSSSSPDIERLLSRLHKVNERLGQQMHGLTEWIQSPHYDIDHPVGRIATAASRDSFEGKQ